jgi:2-hydroxy-6-oxonona-2,4-dienedioate hydrolase
VCLWQKRWLLVVLLAFAVGMAAWFLLENRRAHARISGVSVLIATPFGDVEYLRGGAGPPVLVVHGSGGGFDQGALLAGTLLGDGFDWIAPSRFGYLRSSLPAGASFDEQARAYAHLLDALGLERVAVVALSHGAPSALLFALLHPERVSSLTLISGGVAASTQASQSGADRKGDTLTALWRFDVGYWAASRFMRGYLMRLMGADDAVIAALTLEQRALVDRLIDEMNPAAPRHPGVVFDNRAALPGARIAAIRAPVLIVHARDDALQLFHNAEFAAAHIPRARLLAFERGGHLLLAVERPTLRVVAQEFILNHH